ncbi:MAG: DUF4157 domain-containing protein, partial [Mangrovimonas sp.]|nr:DUF4157 domain-containing protein [Mangrovimonas sp.]
TARLQATKGSGQHLSAHTRAQMEGAFGADLSGVRIHTDGAAVGMNRDLRAQAFTHGRDIYFGSGKFQPETTEGRRLLAHELVHVGQQGKAVRGYLQRKIIVDEKQWSEDQAKLYVWKKFRYKNIKKARDRENMEKARDRAWFNRLKPLIKNLEVYKVSEEELLKFLKGNITADQFRKAQNVSEDKVDNVAADFNSLLKDWRFGASVGVRKFVLDELTAKRNNNVDKGKLVIAFIGNTIWAAAAFVPLSWAAFTVAMAGITLGTFATQIRRSNNRLITIKYILDVLDKAINISYSALDRKSPEIAKKVLNDQIKRDGKTNRRQAIREMCAKTFKREFVELKYPRVQVKVQFVSDTFKKNAKNIFEFYKILSKPQYTSACTLVSAYRYGAISRKGRSYTTGVYIRGRLALITINEIWEGLNQPIRDEPSRVSYRIIYSQPDESVQKFLLRLHKDLWKVPLLGYSYNTEEEAKLGLRKHHKTIGFVCEGSWIDK